MRSRNLNGIDTYYIDSHDYLNENILFLYCEKIRSFREINPYIFRKIYSGRNKSISENLTNTESHPYRFSRPSRVCNIDFKKTPFSYMSIFIDLSTKLKSDSCFLSNIKKTKLKNKYMYNLNPR